MLKKSSPLKYDKFSVIPQYTSVKEDEELSEKKKLEEEERKRKEEEKERLAIEKIEKEEKEKEEKLLKEGKLKKAKDNRTRAQVMISDGINTAIDYMPAYHLYKAVKKAWPKKEDKRTEIEKQETAQKLADEQKHELYRDVNNSYWNLITGSTKGAVGMATGRPDMEKVTEGASNFEALIEKIQGKEVGVDAATGEKVYDFERIEDNRDAGLQIFENKYKQEAFINSQEQHDNNLQKQMQTIKQFGLDSNLGLEQDQDIIALQDAGDQEGADKLAKEKKYRKLQDDDGKLIGYINPKVEDNGNLIAATHDVSTVERMYRDSYFDLVGMSKIINEANPEQIWDASSILGKAGQLINNKFENNKNTIASIAEQGDMLAGLNELPGTSHYAKSFNEKLLQFKTMNWALQLNADPESKEEQDIFYEQIWSGLKGEVTNDESINAWGNIKDMNGLESLNVADRPDDSMLGHVLQGIQVKGVPAREVFEGGVGVTKSLIPLVIEVAATKKLAGGSIKKAVGAFTKFANGKNAGRIRSGIVSLTGAMASEAAVLAGADVIAKEVVEPIVGIEAHPFVIDLETGNFTPTFAMALGAGNQIGGAIIKRWAQVDKGAFGRSMAKINDFTIGKGKLKVGTFPVTRSKWAQGIVGASAGTGSFIFATGVQMNIDQLRSEHGGFYWNENVRKKYLAEVDENGKPLYTEEEAIKKAEEEINQHFGKAEMMKTYIGMRLLSSLPGNKNPFGSLGSTVEGIKTDVRVAQGSTSYSRRAAKMYGLKTDQNNTTEEIENRKEELLSKVTDPEKAKEINAAAEELHLVNDIKDAKKLAKEHDVYVSGLINTSKLGGKLISGEKPTSKEAEAIGKLSDYEYNFIKSRLGFSKGSEQGIMLDLMRSSYKSIYDQITEQKIYGKTRTKMVGDMVKYSDVVNKIEKLKREIETDPLKEPINKSQITKLEEKKEVLENTMDVDYKSWQSSVKAQAKKYDALMKVYSERLEADGRYEFVDRTRYAEMMMERGMVNEKGNEIKTIEEALKATETSEGFYDRYTDQIFLNQSVQRRNMNPSTAMHEIIHRVLRNSFKDANGKLTKNGLNAIDAFNDILKRKDPEAWRVVEERMDGNYKYNVDGVPESGLKPKELYYEDYLTVYFDALSREQIPYSKSTGEVLTDFVMPFIRKIPAHQNWRRGKKYTPQTGKDLYNLMRGFHKTASKGEVLEKAVELGKEGPKMEEGEGSIQESREQQVKDLGYKPDGKRYTQAEWKSSKSNQKVRDEVLTDLLDKGVELESAIDQANRAAITGVAKARLELFGDKAAGKTGLLDGVILKGIDTRGGNVYGKPVADFVEDVKKELDPAFFKFNPEVNDNISGYMNFIISKKRPGVIDRYEKEKFAKPTEGEGAPILKVETGGPKETIGKQIKIYERLGKVGETINEKIQNKLLEGDPKTLEAIEKGFKGLKGLVTTDVQRMFGIEPKPGNLTHPDITNAQMFIAKNADLLWGTVLPEGYNMSYKSTGVTSVLMTERPTQKNQLKEMQDVFYEKVIVTKRKGGKTLDKKKRPINLEIQKKRTDISIPDFKKVFGITERKQRNEYKKEDNTSARVRGIVAETERMMVNQAIREKMAELGYVAEAFVASLGEGKSRLAFAKDRVLEKEKVYVNTDRYISGEFLGEALKAQEIVEKHGFNSKEYRRFEDLMGEDVRLLMNDYFRLNQEKYDKGGYIELMKNDKDLSPEFTKAIKNGDYKLHKNGKLIKKQADDLVKAIPEINKYTPKETLEAMSTQGGKPGMNVFGYQRGYLDAAKEGRKTGKPGSHRKEWEKVVKGKFGKLRRTKEGKVIGDPKDGIMMNKDLGMKKILKIYQDLGSFESKLKQWIDVDASKLYTAGETNMEMFHDVAFGIKKAYDAGKIPAKIVHQLYQLQTNIAKGFRSLSRAEYMWIQEGNLQPPMKPSGFATQAKEGNIDFLKTKEYKKFKDGMKDIVGFKDQYKESLDMFIEEGFKSGEAELLAMNRTHKKLTWKGEHLGPNARTMKDIASQTIRGVLTPESLKKALKDHNQFFAPTWVTDIIDKIGTTSPEGVKRFLKSPLGQEVKHVEALKNIYHASGTTAFDYLLEKAQTDIITEALETQTLSRLNRQAKKGGIYPQSKNSKKALENLRIIGEAIDLGRKANKEKKGMSAWDFDDTLAYTKSGVRYRMPNPSGQPQPSRKVIFMAGGPGSGKSTVIKGLGLEKQGFKIVNQDISLQWLAKNNGLPTDMRDFTPEQASKWGSLGWDARMIAKRKQTKFQGKGDGIVVDGTGNSLKVMENQVQEFRNKGYDVQMVFVETSLETALARNLNRKERSLKDGIVIKTHESVQNNKEAFRKLFGNNFAEVKTDNLKQSDPIPIDVIKKMNGFTKGYIKGRLEAGEFADKGESILAKGGEFDFAEFDYVKEGKKGPLFGKAMDRAKKFGLKDQFIITARPHAAKIPIFRFLDAQGLKIPFENIITLENSSAEAKAMWMLEKFKEGYNDMYFADDALQNVEAVKKVLDQLDIKSKVQQVIKFSKDNLSNDFNQIIEDIKGVAKTAEYKSVTARMEGAKKGKYKWVIPPSAADFELLTSYTFAGKGKKGEAHQEWWNKNLFKPFARGVNDINTAKQTTTNDYLALRKLMPDARKLLKKKVAGTGFTHDAAVRVHRWTEAGFEVPGISKKDLKLLNDVVSNSPELKAFSDALGKISKTKEGWVEPTEHWLAENITADLHAVTSRVGRKQHLAEWIENKNIIFSEKNMNKIEAVYGKNHREALEDMLWRMEHGTNRTTGRNALTNKFMNWTNNSVGAVMFFNMRSAGLQLLSSVNYVNWKENNPLKAARAFANQPQYWKDFSKIFNSDMLKQRRAGLKMNVNEAEIAAAVEGSSNKAQAALSWLLKKGFLPTQAADSFAIASGGSTFYRNKIKAYEKQGLETKEAEKKAWTDFQEIAEKTQQSARPDLISQQQASPLGRLILAFANTPMQYARIMKKSAMDLSTGRGDAKSHVSRIAYYGAIQSMIFASLQSGMFSMLFDDELDEDYIDKKSERVANTMVDGLLRGTGVAGASISAVKNGVVRFMNEDKKDYNADYMNVVVDMLNVSPTIGSKVRKLKGAGDGYKWNEDIIPEMGWDIENPGLHSAANVVSATTNIPLDRLVTKINNLKGAMDAENETWQRIAQFMGYNRWDLGMDKPKAVIEAKEIVKEKKKKISKEKAKIKEADKQAELQSKINKQIEQEKELQEKGLLVDPKCSFVSSKGSRCKISVANAGDKCTVHEKKEQNKTGEKTQCKFMKQVTKKRKERCGMQTSNKSGYCYYHD